MLSKSLFQKVFTQSAITCSKLTIEALEQGVKYVPVCRLGNCVFPLVWVWLDPGWTSTSLNCLKRITGSWFWTSFLWVLPLFRLDFVKYCGYQDWKDRSLKWKQQYITGLLPESLHIDYLMNVKGKNMHICGASGCLSFSSG